MDFEVTPNYATEIADALWRCVLLREQRRDAGYFGQSGQWDEAVEQADNDLAAVLSNPR